MIVEVVVAVVRVKREKICVSKFCLAHMRGRLLVERGQLLEVLGHLGSIEAPYIYLKIITAL